MGITKICFKKISIFTIDKNLLMPRGYIFWRSSSMIIAGAVLGIPQLSAASSTTAGKVGEIAMNSDGTARVDFSGARTALPACHAAAYPRSFGFFVNTPEGQAMLSLLLSDRATNKSVTIYGSSTCVTFSNIENISAIAEAN